MFVERTVSRAQRVITISEVSKSEIVRHMNVEPGKVIVVHSAGREADEIQPTPAPSKFILMQHASLFALYEGFGIPILDAQQAGVPIVCSSAGALPEIAGEGAIVFDPYSVDDMAKAISRASLDPDLRTPQIKKRFENARRFSWGKTARETLAVYSAVAS